MELTLDQVVAGLAERELLKGYQESDLRAVLADMERSEGHVRFPTYKLLAARLEPLVRARAAAPFVDDFARPPTLNTDIDEFLGRVAEWEKTKRDVPVGDGDASDHLDFDDEGGDPASDGANAPLLPAVGQGAPAAATALAREVLEATADQFRQAMKAGPAERAAAILLFQKQLDETIEAVVERCTTQTIKELMPWSRARVKAGSVLKGAGALAELFWSTGALVAEALSAELSIAAEEVVGPGKQAVGTAIEGRLKRWSKQKIALYIAVRSLVGAAYRIPFVSNAQAAVAAGTELAGMAANPVARVTGHRPYTPASAEELGDRRAVGALQQAIARVEGLRAEASSLLTSPAGDARRAELDKVIARLDDKWLTYNDRLARVRTLREATADRGKMPLLFEDE